MRSQTQERIEELARERGVSAIDLALVEDGIEIGKKMMAEMIATYSASSASPSTGAVAAPARVGRARAIERRCPERHGAGRQRERLPQRGEPADRASVQRIPRRLIGSVSAYRFCRTDDIGLLVDALNRCWAPHFPDEPPTTPASFKRSIRDLQVWCSSCMVAFSGSDPIGVLIGAKRPSGTLIHKIAVHPDHVRQGHGRHLLTSLGSKLAILGPPRMVAEVQETFDAACGLFSASGYAQETFLTDYVLHPTAHTTRRGGPGEPVEPDAPEVIGGFVIPVTVDDLAANGLLEEAHSPVCWERSVETLTARKDDLAGLAVASDERIEAYILYTPGPTMRWAGRRRLWRSARLSRTAAPV